MLLNQCPKMFKMLCNVLRKKKRGGGGRGMISHIHNFHVRNKYCPAIIGKGIIIWEDRESP